MAEVVLAKIRSMRLERRLTAEKVAHAIGYETGKGYYDLEKGRVSLKLDHLERLAEFYGVPVSSFFCENSTKMVRTDC